MTLPSVSEAAHRDRLASEQLDALFGAVLVGVAGAAIAAWIAVLLLVPAGGIPIGPGLAWALYITVCASLHSLLGWLRAWRKPARAQWRRWATAFTVVAFFEGAGWGLLPILAASGGHVGVEMLGTAMTVGVAAGSIIAFSPFMPTFSAFLFPATLPYAAWTLLTGHDRVHRTATILTVIFAVAIFVLARISARRYATLIRLQIEKDEQVELAANANGVLASFLGMASHELRQPVQALNNWVGVLGNIPLPAEARRPLEVIQQQTIKVDQIFSALLDLSLLDAGKVEPRLRPFPLEPLLQSIHAEALPTASGKGLRLRHVSTRAVVYSDAVMVERVVSNLVRNAIRYTECGGVLIGCRRRQCGRALAIQVCDTGPGIRRDQWSRIFEPFYQVDRPSPGRAEGVGLGLAIVRRLCTLLDARLRLDSEPGRGTLFEFVLPAAQGVALELETEEGMPVLSSGLIAIVDDDQSILESTAALLRQWGYEVAAARSGDEVLAELARHETLPILIVSDFQLRGEENGIELIERLRTEYNEDIPGLLITGDTAEAIADRARAAGLPLLLKPVPNARLRAAIVNLAASAREKDEAATIK